ncbi:MAG: lipid A deacylase LpxR family protein [Gammaproteobacteria bacterium]|nr:lipid A deacylase LpxR family protein [Gammaproteobacteria bacterium]
MSRLVLFQQTLRLMLLIMVWPGSGSAVAQEPERFMSLQLENDFFANSGDRYYTHGTQLSLMKLETPPAWLDTVAGWTPFYQPGSDGTSNLVQYTVGQKIFTPNDTDAAHVLADDRPYAGYLYVGIAVLSHVSSHNNVDTGNLFEITLGIVGPSALSEQTQTSYHDLIGIDSPAGWEHQLEDEPAIGLMYSRFWRRVQPLSAGLEFGVNPHVSTSLGNVYTYGATGVMFRIGNNLRRDLSPPNIRPGFPGLPYFKTGRAHSWYGFLGFEGRLVVRDIFLDGNTFSDSHSVEKEWLVGDMQYGVVYLLGDMRIAISNMVRSDEFKTQSVRTRFGAVNLSLSY